MLRPAKHFPHATKNPLFARATPPRNRSANPKPYPMTIPSHKQILKLAACACGLFWTTGLVHGEWAVADLPGNELPGQRVVISHDGRTVAEFIHGEGQAKPYLALFNKGGERLTNPGIDARGQETGRFPHHRGIYIGWNKIESELGTDDLWHMRKTRMVVDSVEKRMVDAGGVEIIANIRWLSQKKDGEQNGVLINERRTIRVLVLGGDLQHAGLHFRAAAEVDEVRDQTRYLWSPADLDPGTGRIVSNNLEWVNFRFPLHGHWYSVTQLNHPGNQAGELSWRDYGRFGFFRTARMAAGEEISFQGRFLVEELEGAGDESMIRTRADRDYQSYAGTGERRGSQNLSARPEKDRVVIEINGSPFTAYRLGNEGKYPFLRPLITGQ